MLPEIHAISSEDEIKKFLTVITDSFITVADEFGITSKTAPSNPAFITLEKLVYIYKNCKCFGLYLNMLPIGFFALEESENSVLLIEKISVLPDFRHKGYGKMILDYSLNFALKNNFKTISIALINENSRLKKWYSDFGFIEVNVAVIPHLPFEVCFMEYNSGHPRI